MKKTGKLLLSFLLMLSFIFSGLSTFISVEAADEPYTVIYPDAFEGDFRVILNEGEKFEWLKVYVTTYTQNEDTGELTLKEEKKLYETYDGSELIPSPEDNRVSMTFTVENYDYIFGNVEFKFKKENDDKIYSTEWTRPDPSKFKPSVLSVSTAPVEKSGYYDVILTCDTGLKSENEKCEIIAVHVYDENNNKIDEVRLDEFKDYDFLEDGSESVTYSCLLGGYGYKFIVENTFGVLSDAFNADQLKNLEVPDELKEKDEKPAVPTESGITLKVSKKNSGSTAKLTATTNKKCTIVVDGVYEGKTKNNKLNFKLLENGTYTIRAVDSKGTFTEKKVKITGLKRDKSKAPNVTSREEWNDSSENNSKLPQTGTVAVGTVILLAVICAVVGLIVYKKKGVKA